MFKKAIVATALVALTAVPAFADPLFGRGTDNDQVRAQITAGLAAHGIIASEIEDWGGLVRAQVIGADGVASTQFFDPDSLVRVR